MSAKFTVFTSDWRAAPIQGLEVDQYVIGDVHGHSGELFSLLDVMGRERAENAELTFLGDLIDRGPDSLGALAIAARAKSKGWAEVHHLFGNHEVMFLLSEMAGMDGSGAFQTWINNGGKQVLDQFNPQAFEHAVNNRVAVMEYLIKTLPQEVQQMLKSLKTYRSIGNVVLVHAGIKPGVDMFKWLDACDPFNLWDEESPQWIRFPFILNEGGFEGERIIVHGHTQENIVLKMLGLPLNQAHYIHNSRLNLDGGSYQSGIVAGAQLSNGRYRVFLSTLKGEQNEEV